MVDATLARLQESRSDAPPQLFVQGTVREESHGFLVSLALKDAHGRAVGEREVRVEGQSCKAVEGHGALVLALMIAVALPHGDQHAESPGEPETAPPVSPPPTPPSPVLAAGASTARRRPRPSSSAARPPRLLVGAAGTASVGVLPTAGFGFELGAMYSPRSLVLIGLAAGFEASGAVRARGGEIGFQLLSAAARFGVSALRTERFEIIPIVDLRAGLIRASPRGLRILENEDRTLLFAGLGVLARAKLVGRLFAEALPEVEAVFFRRQFELRDAGKLYRVHRVSPFDARLSLRLGYEF
jgi:hypothetical protein